MTYKFLLNELKKKKYSRSYCLVRNLIEINHLVCVCRWLSLSGDFMGTVAVERHFNAVFQLCTYDDVFYVCVYVFMCMCISSVQIFGELFYASHVT